MRPNNGKETAYSKKENLNIFMFVTHFSSVFLQMAPKRASYDYSKVGCIQFL